MTERLRGPVRRTGMKRSLLLAAVVTLCLAGCGETGKTDATGSATVDPSATIRCATLSGAGSPTVVADLDGDGVMDRLVYLPGHGRCPASLGGLVGRKAVTTIVQGDLPVDTDGLRHLTIPGRNGQVVLATERNPRGGFQVSMYGFADGALQELLPDGRPLVPFVATDATTSPVSVACTPTGFEVTRAKAHGPAGGAAAWDVSRTSYTLSGNTFSDGTPSVVAEDVSDNDLAKRFPDLLAYRVLSNCKS